jgi:hypothetical protein
MKHKKEHVCFSIKWHKISLHSFSLHLGLKGCAFLFWGFFFCSHSLKSQPESKALLSPQSKISLLTCGAGSELYEAFGHSAIRVHDPQQGLDVVFNYGVFDFQQENFYGNFAMGYMKYMLGVSTMEDFLYSYKRAKRSVREQVLNLDSTEKMKIVRYLEVNLKPENIEYFYNYFYNNCSTKIVELLDSALNKQVVWNFPEPNGTQNFRSLIRQYTIFQHWGRLGIDLGLGAPIDKSIRPKDLDFLPDGLEQDLNRAFISRAGMQFPLVIESRTLFQAPAFYGEDPFWLRPGFIFSLILLVSVFLFLKTKTLFRARKIWALSLLLLVSILGWVETLIWFFTNHKASAWNYNILWASPLWFFLVFYNIAYRHKNLWLHSGLRLYYASVLVFWFLLPQQLNENLIPLVFALLVNALPVEWISGQKENTPVASN